VEPVRVASIGSLTGLFTQAVIGQNQMEEVCYYVNDHLGTPQRVMDEDGRVVWSAVYLPFGHAEVSTETVTNHFRFPGQYFDQETGFHYNYHRYYDLRTGRYLRPDPIGLAGGINLYLYAAGTPINEIDPLGLLFGFNAGEAYGEYAAQYYADITIDPCASSWKKAGAWVGGLFASLWTPETSNDTFLTLLPSGAVGKWFARPFWRYVGPHSSKAITWVTRGWGWKSPFGTNFVKAAEKLHLLEYGGVPTDVIKVPYRMLKPIAGPRLVRAWGKYTGAVEYYYGSLFFLK